ncbi:BnaA04g24640D [Brassica napus]|uniref:(rape) hypothetical protein n=1 Tax=Brassica napus TaxID=3708 RepID=A0A078IDK2_BRANA|nr:unnamed protein product [Brassica napus]CDY47986.1 BnaA04g24640D [Brassica napus]
MDSSQFCACIPYTVYDIKGSNFCLLFVLSCVAQYNHGLMPNPKQGSVTKDVMKAVKDAKAGHTKFRMDKTSILHVPLGKVTHPFEKDYIIFIRSCLLLFCFLYAPSKYAGYVNAFHLCSTMGKGYPVSIQSLSRAADHYTKLQLK